MARHEQVMKKHQMERVEALAAGEALTTLKQKYLKRTNANDVSHLFR